MKSAQFDDKPGQKYRQYSQVKYLGLLETPDPYRLGAEDPDEEIAGGENAQEKEEQAPLRFEP